MILFMPTWRGAHYPDGEAFRGTQFYQSCQALLNSPRLHKMLEQYGYTLVFYPHIEMQKHLTQFHTDSARVCLADSKTHDVQQLLLDCALLITDYSSVFFDVAYLEKPELYYQFDEAEFRQYHYKQGYFDYRRDGFGRCAPPRTHFCRRWKRLCSTGWRCCRNTKPGRQPFFRCGIPRTVPAPTRPSAACDREKVRIRKKPPAAGWQRGLCYRFK